MTATTALSPQNQAILNALLGTKGTLGGAAGNLATDLFPSLSSAPDFGTAAGSLTNLMLDRHDAYMDPYRDREREQLYTEMTNRGLVPGGKAFGRANMELRDNQARQRGEFLNSAQPLAFQQAVQQYLTPIDVISKIMGLSGPMDINNINTPTFSQTAPQMSEIFKNNFQNEMQFYNNNLNMLSGLAGTVAGLPTGAGGTIGSAASAGIGSGLAALLGLA